MKIKRATCSVDTCNFQCNDFGKMRVHEYEEHGIGEECKCKFCGKKFNNFRVLDKHHKICQTEKDKDCPVCRKAYKSTERLVNHMETQHSDKPRLVCESCGGVFISPDSLEYTKLTSINEKVQKNIEQMRRCTYNRAPKKLQCAVIGEMTYVFHFLCSLQFF